MHACQPHAFSDILPVWSEIHSTCCQSYKRLAIASHQITCGKSVLDLVNASYLHMKLVSPKMSAHGSPPTGGRRLADRKRVGSRLCTPITVSSCPSSFNLYYPVSSALDHHGRMLIIQCVVNRLCWREGCSKAHSNSVLVAQIPKGTAGGGCHSAYRWRDP